MAKHVNRRTVRKGKVVAYTLTAEPNKLLALYQTKKIPKLGPFQAHGELTIGSYALNKRASAATERVQLDVPYTLNNLTDHWGWLIEAMDYFKTHSQNRLPPTTVFYGAKEKIKELWINQTVEPLRRYMREFGIEGVKSYFYVVPQLVIRVDEKGELVLDHEKDNPLCIVPYSLELARKRWQISDEVITQLAMSAVWVVYALLPRIRKNYTRKTADQLFVDWKDVLPTGMLHHFQDNMGQGRLISDRRLIQDNLDR